MYTMVATWPDLAHVVGVVSRYMSNLGWKHWEAVEHILRYMRGTKDARLTFGLNNLTEVEGYTNSDYARNTDNQKSTSCYVFTYGGGAISWRSKLLDFMTMSTTEAYDMATSDATKEVVWLYRLSTNFSPKRWLDHPTLTIYYDFHNTIHLIRNPFYRVKMNLIELRFHKIRKLVTEKKLKVRKIDTEVNIVDCLTKPLPEQRIRALRTMRGLWKVTE